MDHLEQSTYQLAADALLLARTGRLSRFDESGGVGQNCGREAYRPRAQVIYEIPRESGLLRAQGPS